LVKSTTILLQELQNAPFSEGVNVFHFSEQG
jgi:hypothetical protein